MLAAANEVIARSDKLTLGLMLLAQLVFCAMGFRSLVAGLLFVGVVLMSNTFGMALMAYWNVGLNVNTLPVISLGIGFGEDYGIYIVSRAIEEYQRQDRSDLNHALIDGVATAGQGRALHGVSNLGQHRLLGVFAAALSGRDGHPVADHSDDEHARRFVALACADCLAETEICHG